MKAPYTIIQVQCSSTLIGLRSSVIVSKIPTLAQALKMLTYEHKQNPYYEYLITDNQGKAIRHRYKNGPATYTTRTIDGEPLYQSMAAASTQETTS